MLLWKSTNSRATAFTFLLVACAATQVFAQDGAVFGYERLEFLPPVGQQAELIEEVLGREFITARISGEPQLEVAVTDLNADGLADIVARQLGTCTNHWCDYYFINTNQTQTIFVDRVLSRGNPYVRTEYKAEDPTDYAPIVVFQKLTDDCESCSAPSPIELFWNQDWTSQDAGRYAFSGVIDDEAGFVP